MLEFMLDSTMVIWSGSAAAKSHDNPTSYSPGIRLFIQKHHLCMGVQIIQFYAQRTLLRSPGLYVLSVEHQSDPHVSHCLFQRSSTCRLFSREQTDFSFFWDLFNPTRIISSYILSDGLGSFKPNVRGWKRKPPSECWVAILRVNACQGYLVHTTNRFFCLCFSKYFL